MGNCAGWEVRSLEARFLPDVTLGNDQTSVGFLPNGLTLILPFLF
ncbi:hypothetical protein PCC9214_02011 [Planktothrix tepida]|uniref:Uncharacterized protein n=2 Tax=Planktothrix TaxID=54304 RepID=A0A1J1LM63_9CYAN|nr:hypothetical protein PCC9214_02011 [Planktothrix tepida]CAD5969057.1 hypothetical protein NO713_03697 [Planktothrix pseudagardhii]CUR33028.1 hypothetical protein PL9214500275 [Planktothrix tepida PCC 9214]